jgi:hypothetical protein
MNDYISKPIRVEALVQALNKYRHLRKKGARGLGVPSGDKGLGGEERREAREEKEELQMALLPIGQFGLHPSGDGAEGTLNPLALLLIPKCFKL